MTTQQQTFSLETLQDMSAQEDFSSFLRAMEDLTLMELKGLGSDGVLKKPDLEARLEALKQMQEALAIAKLRGWDNMPALPPQAGKEMAILYNQFKAMNPKGAQYLISGGPDMSNPEDGAYRYLPGNEPAAPAPTTPQPQVQQPAPLTPQQKAKRRMKLLEKLGLVPTLDPKVGGQN